MYAEWDMPGTHNPYRVDIQPRRARHAYPDMLDSSTTNPPKMYIKPKNEEGNKQND